MSTQFTPPSFDRAGSTLGIMDDLQIAVHTYDGCGRGCPGCVVDKHFKNQARGQPILSLLDMELIHSRVSEYYQWVRENLNTKSTGYFGTHKYRVEHFSYTCRFGNHSELPLHAIADIAGTLAAEFKVFSTAPTEDISRFVDVQRFVPGKYFLEIIYDPVADRASDIRAMVLEMRRHGILGYPEVLITRRLLDSFSPQRFVDEAVAPLGDVGTQMQFGRYSPSKTRSFNTRQLVPLDEEVRWLAEVSRRIVEAKLDIHPIPIGEYGVTLLDEYGERAAWTPQGIDESRLPPPESFNMRSVWEHTRDIFLTSLYIDHDLNVFVWSESMGQHVLDSNFGFPSLGNLRKSSIQDMVSHRGGAIDRMLSEVVRQLTTHEKCAPCRYKSFCASHAVPLFRKWQDDSGEHCYGYIPVIREFQKSPQFLDNMIQGFRDIGF